MTLKANSSNNRGERNLSIDLIKIIAMALVVCLHTTFAYIRGDGLSLPFILYNTADVAIPLFFMVSGYLLLGRRNVSFRYSACKILKIIRFVFIITLLYFIRMYIINDELPVKYLIIFFAESFIQRGPMGFFWYFGAMCIIYLVLPFLNSLYKRNAQFVIVLAFIVGVQSMAFVGNVIGHGEYDIIQPLRLWNWLAYFMLGGLVKKYKFRVNRFWAAVVIVAGLLIDVLTIKKLHPFMATGYCEYFYPSAVVILLVCSIFVFIESIHIKDSRVIRALSACFLPVYSFHILVMDLISPFAKESELGCVIYWFTILTITTILSLILVRVPLIKNIFKI